MTDAVKVIRDGHAFQAMQFWLQAANLLNPVSPVIRVGFESGPKAFDDLWVEYDPARAPQNAYGRPLSREHFQCKWHVSPGDYGYADLIAPEFIGASTHSLLQRALSAQRTHAPTGDGLRLTLVSNWQPSHSDPLAKLVRANSGAIHLARLREGKTARSAMGQVRQTWLDHLNIPPDELFVLARTLGFVQFNLPFHSTREWLNDKLVVAGLCPIPAHQSDFRYEDVLYQWMGQGRQVFNATELQQACRQEGLLAQATPRPMAFGVKSFEHRTDRLEDRCVKVLNLLPEFQERFIREPAAWNDHLYPTLEKFLVAAAQEAPALRLVLDAHATLAFAAGSILDLKAGRAIELEQRTVDREIWHVADQERDPSWPTLQSEVIEIDLDKPDLAVALGLTHANGAEVERYAREHLPSVGKVVVYTPADGASRLAVRCGGHANQLAEAMCAHIKTFRQPGARIHLFAAAPNTVTFFVGQRRAHLGQVTLYEYDMEGERTGSYEPSLSLPVSIREAPIALQRGS